MSSSYKYIKGKGCLKCFLFKNTHKLLIFFNVCLAAQLFQEILVKNESLVKEKEELEELLKQMLLDKEMSRIKSPFKPSQISYQPQQQQGEVFFNANEPQRPYEISENSYNKANNSFSAQPNYEYLNDADDKIYSKSMHQKPLTVYEKLGGQSQISKLIDIFSEKALKDQRICGFFWNFDKATMKNNMKAFFNELFDGPERISREKPIQQKMRINDFHFDVIKNHLISSLVELRVGEDLREEVADFVEKSRKNIVFQSPRNITEKLGGEDQVAKLMDVFYEKVMKDQQICGLFWNFDAVAMKNNQKAFFAELFGESKNTNNENILYKKIRITDSHFDVIKSHLVKSLQDLKVPEDLVKEFEKIVENSRKTIVYKDPMTIFEKLGSQEQITKLMDNFNEKVIKDQSVCGFFWNFDKETMKINQKAFFHELLGEVKSNNNINDKILYKKMRISNSHFDSIKNHLLSSLLEVKVTENLRKEVEGLAENSRKNIVFTADNDNNNNLPKDNENNKSKQDQYQEINFEENNTTTSNEKPKKAYINETPTPEKNGKSILKTSNINNESPGPSEEESLRFLQEIHTHSAQRFDQSLYLRIGGFDKITSLVEKFYEKQLQDSRINSLYEGNDLTRLLHNFKYFLTKIFGGPDIFLGKSLKDCDPNMNTSNFYSEVSMENFRFAAEELMFPEENIEQMLEILNKKVEIKFVEPSPQTIYELLGGYKSIAILVETLYKRLNEGFYVDMKEEYEKMKQNQKFYITKILGGPDTFLGENGRSFWKDPWLMKSGVEKWLEILEGALNDMGVRKDVAEKVKEIFGQEIK